MRRYLKVPQIAAVMGMKACNLHQDCQCGKGKLMNEAANIFVETKRIAFHYFVCHPSEKKQSGNCQSHSEKKKRAEREPNAAEKINRAAQQVVDVNHFLRI
jgi:hypothetical protein